MSEEKQIEEMAKILCGMKNGCDGCMWDKVHCNERSYAEEIYNADYRKQSEGEWEKRVFIIFDSEKVGYRCTECSTTWDTPTPYCPNCGAKMKGV
jgi:hypothetical protein